VTSVIVGAAKRYQLDDNLAAADLALSPAEIAALEAATALAPVYPNWFMEKLGDGPSATALGYKADGSNG
jgi:diketogulonate reductase-like aldo/keto reductase